MPTKATTRLFLSLIAGGSLLTACNGGGLTAPQAAPAATSAKALKPVGPSMLSGYVVAERTPVDSLAGNTIQGLTNTLTQTSGTIKKLPPLVSGF